ncbi:MAG: lipopolysaccharide biosynthesis protein [Hyphomicrobiaceae bacterium]|nr:lipopolysaccharide biosynthesis protein [Hyphomicrobiaceae bacterium]
MAQRAATAAAQPFNGDVRAQLVKAAATVVNVLKGENETTRTQRDALTAFAVRVASAALLYLSQIVLARWMGGFEYGIYVFVWTWVLVLGGLSHLGLNLVMIRLIPEYREKGEFDLLRGLLRGGRLAALGIGTIFAALGAAMLWAFGSHIENHFVLPLFLALVCVPMFALTDIQDGIGRGQAWMGVALLPPYVLRPLLLLAAMSVAYLAGLPMQATTAAGAAILATWLAALIQTAVINRRLAHAMPSGTRAYDFGFWFKTSAPLMMIVGADLVLQNTDLLVISRYLTPTDVGIYYAAAKTMALIMFVHYAVGSAVANRFAALNARGDREGLRQFVRDAVNWTFWPSLLCAVAILALGKPLLWLFGPKFTEGYPVMFVLVIGFLFRSAMGPAEFLLNMLGEQALCATVLSFTALLNIALNFALVPNFGLMGAATATALSLVTAAVMNYIVVRRRLDIEIGIWKNVGKR